MKEWTVADVMTGDVCTVPSDMRYREVVDVLTGGGISAAPVVDAAGRVVGVVSEADLLHRVELAGRGERPRLFESRHRRAGRTRAAARTAGELMTRPAVTVTTGTPISAAARLLDRRRVKRLPVLDDTGRLAGIVSRSDLLKIHLRGDADIRADVAELVRHVVPEPGALDVTVTDGVVTLDGRVERRTTAEAVVQLAATVAGVTDVVDRVGYEFSDTDPLRRGTRFGTA
ncbi:CBS domain-containing protein [Spirilliplanes yamanashiensis]|uniref:BON domain-containing protein n=1 Tax=Spirilliplanes yamanashiensis TaxID=42233 RepID=A0A8J3YFF2_9ACTN|nr:CBS domain-containing protein [Spirilliplanes yamanashiensis]MDP9818299.1 CBS domain-containing protein [Spirilliplanes yamanashiensis]GIJ06715.1 hypothetical protein Sya03_60670 [Spirilliplanes yamanashiensis]